MKEKDTKKTFIILIFLSIFFIILVFIINYITYNRNKNITLLRTNWTITYHDKTFTNVNLKTFKFYSLKTDDIILLERNFDDIDTFTYPMINMLTNHLAIEVYADDSLIYSANMNLANTHKFIGAGYNKFNLPIDYAHKKLTIKAVVCRNNAFTYFMPITIGESLDICNNFFTSSIMYFIISIFLITFGAVFFIIALILCRRFSELFQLVYVSLYSILTGTWTICTSKILQLFIPSFSITSIIEYSSLYLCPSIVALMFFYIFNKNKIQKKVFFTFFCINTSFCIIVFLLQLLNIVHLPAFLIFFHTMSALELLYCLWIVFHAHGIAIYYQRMMLNGLIFFIMFAFVDILRFDIMKFIGLSELSMYSSVLPFGATVFIISLFISYGLLILNKLAEHREQEHLIELAYTDCLTHIYNRTKCEEIMHTLQENDDEYIIVSIDLNGLKTLNDTKGHSYGDWLLSSFANTLKKYFSPYGYVGRMGGDEFIIFLPNISKFNKISILLSNFKSETKLYNLNLKDFQFDFAYGYASSKEINQKDAKLVYELADTRMYEMKVNMKHSRNFKHTLSK